MLDPVAELRQHVGGDVLRSLGDEEDADSLRADEPDGLHDRIQEGVRRVGEEQVRFVEEEDELRLRDVADLGQLLEQLGEQPHEDGREQLGLVLDGGQFEARDDPAAVGGHAQQVGEVELRLAEELRPAAVLELDERAEQDADRGRRDSADPLELGLALVGLEEGEQRPQVGEVEDGEALLVRVPEDEREALLLGLVRLEDLGEQQRAEVRDRCADGHARADPAERQKLGREALRLPLLPQLDRALLRRAACLARLRDPGEIALHVGGDHGDTRRRELLGEQLERPRLPGSRRAGDQPMPVRGGERETDGGLLDHLTLVDGAAEVEPLALEGVGLGNRLPELRHAAGTYAVVDTRARTRRRLRFRTCSAAK